jgi:hypothetical protein
VCQRSGKSILDELGRGDIGGATLIWQAQQKNKFLVILIDQALIWCFT